MIRAALLALLLFCGQALAQPACWPSQIGGSGTRLIVKSDSIGVSYGWGCKHAASGRWYPVQVWGRWSDMAADWQAQGADLAAGNDAAREAAWKKYVTVTRDPATGAATYPLELAGVVLPVWHYIVAMLPAPPQPGGWVVAQTSICASVDRDLTGRCVRRSTYAWDGQIRSATAAAEKVDIGSACDEAIGGAGFYGVLGRVDRVAPCIKR